MKTLIYLVTLLLISCQNCDKLPAHFESYEQAKTIIKDSSFSTKDEMTNIKSSWITSASFYSCDGSSGYMIIGMRGKEYLYNGVPFDVWNDFKKADSKGKFYHRHIKGKYKFKL